MGKAESSDKLIVAGDFNSNIGTGENSKFERVAGKHGHGNTNSAGRRLLEFREEHGMALCGTFFEAPAEHKPTWWHPRFQTGHMIDWIMVRQSDMKNVLKAHTLFKKAKGH